MTIDVHALAAAYSLDALDPDERAEFEMHLAACTGCQAEVAEFGATAAALADGLATPPPPDLKSRVMEQVAQTPQESSNALRSSESPVVEIREHRRRSRSRVLLAVAATLVLLVAGAVVLNGLRGGGTDVDSVLNASDVRVVTLETQVEGTPGRVEVAWSADRDEVALIATGVAEPGSGLTYALWAIADGEPIAAGLFDPDDGSIRESGEVADVQAVAFGITIEPVTGSPSPTGDIIYLGSV